MPADGRALVHDAGVHAVLAAARAVGVSVRAQAFLFCRHGRTSGNALRIFQHPDEPLDAVGHEQAARAAALIAAGPRPTRPFSSSMARAWLTAGHIATALGTPAEASPGLGERSFGALVGSSSAGFDWRDDPPDGETLQAFVQRTSVALSNILSDGGMPLIVAHGGTWLVLAGALEIPLAPRLRENAVPLLVRRAGTGWEALALAGT
jgi:probable phosphoglycerate mutase